MEAITTHSELNQMVKKATAMCCSNAPMVGTKEALKRNTTDLKKYNKIYTTHI